MYDKDYIYAENRLAGSVLCNKVGIPYYIKGLIKDSIFSTVRCDRIESRFIEVLEEEEEEQDLDNFNFSSPKLGMYFNSSRGDIGYLARKPLRRVYRQGVRFNNITSLWGCPHESITYSDLGNCILGASLDLELVKGECYNSKRRRVLSRNTALGYIDSSKEFSLYYKYFGEVGKVLDNGISFKDSTEYLREAIEGELGCL